MQIIGDRKYVEIPGQATHELPPLMVRGSAPISSPDEMMDMAAGIIEEESLIPELPAENWIDEVSLERRKFDLALNLTEQYLRFVGQWRWGDSVLEWIRQCEITFESHASLRNLLRPDVWPHAGRSSFVTLLEDKSVCTGGVALENAVGVRLTFRQPPPIACFSDQFLFYLNSTVALTAYQTWARMISCELADLPPERFHFNVVQMAA